MSAKLSIKELEVQRFEYFWVRLLKSLRISGLFNVLSFKVSIFSQASRNFCWSFFHLAISFLPRRGVVASFLIKTWAVFSRSFLGMYQSARPFLKKQIRWRPSPFLNFRFSGVSSAWAMKLRKKGAPSKRWW